MPLSFRGVFCCCAPFLNLDVQNAQRNQAGQWVADYAPGAPTYVEVEAYTTLGTQVNWAIAAHGPGPVAAPPVGAVDPNDDTIYRIDLSNAVNVLDDANTIRVTATAAGLTQTVDIVVKPLVTALNIVPDHFTFDDGNGNYAIDLTGIVATPADYTANLEVVTNPNNASAWSHVIWAATNTAAGGAGYALQNVGAQERGVRLDGPKNVQTTVGMLDTQQAMPAAVTIDVRAPAAGANLANTLGIRLYRFTYAGGGHFSVTQEDNANFNLAYSSNWRLGAASTPQGYAANNNITLNNVIADVTNAPTANTNVDVRASVYFVHHDGAVTVLQQQVNHTFNNGAGGRQVVGNLNLGNVPNEVMHLDPLLIFWEARNSPAGDWQSLAVTANTVYVTGQAPVNTLDVDLNSAALGHVYTYLSLLDMSCRAANGQPGGNAGEDNVRDAIYAMFNPADPNVNARRITPGAAIQLQYWNGPNAGNPAQSLNDPAGGPTMFNEPNGNIACGVWANMLIAMWALHGKGNGHFVGVWSSKPDDPLNPGMPGGLVPKVGVVQDTRFMVRNWDYSTHGALNAGQYTHNIIPMLPFTPGQNQAVAIAGVAGQNNANPPDSFVNHFIVRDGAAGDFYDPSYGTPASARNAWVEASVGGLRNDNNNRAGFVAANAGSPNGIRAANDAVSLYDFDAGNWIP